jgi:phosphoribosyl-AMP cyclohydrolase
MSGFTAPLSAAAIEEIVAAVAFGHDGLVPVVTQQHDSGEILMLAWMNRTALRATLAEGIAVYWSRSRMALWRKGETSGQTQLLVDLLIDCDADSLVLKVDQTGVACHTGRRSCFFRAARAHGIATVAPVLVDPDTLYARTKD